MNKLMIAIVMALMSYNVSAYWYVTAESPSASGWGEANSKVVAKRRALRECARRTYIGQVCYVTSYRWIGD